MLTRNCTSLLTIFCCEICFCLREGREKMVNTCVEIWQIFYAKTHLRPTTSLQSASFSFFIVSHLPSISSCLILISWTSDRTSFTLSPKEAGTKFAPPATPSGCPPWLAPPPWNSQIKFDHGWTMKCWLKDLPICWRLSSWCSPTGSHGRVRSMYGQTPCLQLSHFSDRRNQQLELCEIRTWQSYLRET